MQVRQNKLMTTQARPSVRSSKPAVKRQPRPRALVSSRAPVAKRTPKSSPGAVVKSAHAAASHARSYDFLHAVGRRKEAIARVRLFPQGTGQVVVNNLELEKYFPTFDYQLVVQQPLKLVGLDSKVDVRVKVMGGGKMGQAEAVRHGIARTLVLMNPELRKNLRTAGFLTRDARVKERKKYGLKKARRAPQFSKR